MASVIGAACVLPVSASSAPPLPPYLESPPSPPGVTYVKVTMLLGPHTYMGLQGTCLLGYERVNGRPGRLTTIRGGFGMKWLHGRVTFDGTTFRNRSDHRVRITARC